MDQLIKRYLTVEEAADYLSLSSSKIYKMVESSEIPHIALNGKRTLRFDKVSLDHWMEKQVVKPRTNGFRESYDNA